MTNRKNPGLYTNCVFRWPYYALIGVVVFQILLAAFYSVVVQILLPPEWAPDWLMRVMRSDWANHYRTVRWILFVLSFILLAFIMLILSFGTSTPLRKSWNKEH
jgi:hypothetical protein